MCGNKCKVQEQIDQQMEVMGLRFAEKKECDRDPQSAQKAPCGKVESIKAVKLLQLMNGLVNHKVEITEAQTAPVQESAPHHVPAVVVPV